jgi:hypothetical protein
MEVQFESRDAEAAPLRDWTLSRLRFSMRRMVGLVPRAAIRLSDVNGPRGGVDKRCQVQLSTEGRGSVLITTVASDWRAAVDQALARAARALRRLWKREARFQRPRARSLTHSL